MGKGDRKKGPGNIFDAINVKKLALFEMAIAYGKALLEKQRKDTELEEERREEMKAPPAYAHFMASGDCDHPGLRRIHEYVNHRSGPKDFLAAEHGAVIARACLEVFGSNGVVRCPGCSLVVSTKFVETGDLWEEEAEIAKVSERR